MEGARGKVGLCLIDIVKSNKIGLLVIKEGQNEVKITMALINIQNNVQESIQDLEKIENVQTPEETEILTTPEENSEDARNQ